ncbi:hypothetical protein LQV63_12250 [Paenibacillus profundus]|uniref:Uncharacterized protein n=1 Tax=Paenibacillus profundus TaxID=1173085 RepID=A0ABS8YG59_9BACL|nr:hypothetical protein [Paenibacillus profundus]MCE5170082.1 hypothetical protein [Paenibacillus profundus]
MLHQIEEAKQGKREAFEPIVEAFRGMAYAVAYEVWVTFNIGYASKKYLKERIHYCTLKA